MKLNNYSVTEYTQVLDKFARAKQVHNHTFLNDYTSENIFYIALGWMFEKALYLALFPAVFIIVNVIKLFTQKN